MYKTLCDIKLSKENCNYQEEIRQLKAEIAKLDGDKTVRIYVFSLANDSFESDFADLERPIELCPIPESILEVYKRIFNGKEAR